MAELPREERNSTMGNKRVKDAPGKIPNTQYTEVKLRQAHKCSLAQADKQTSSDIQVHKLTLTPADKLRQQTWFKP